MSIETPTSKEKAPKPTAELFVPSPENWNGVREDILKLEQLCFGDTAFSDAELEALFTDKDNLVVVLRMLETVIGFSVGIPDEDSDDSLYVEMADIHPEHQENKYIAVILSLLESEARTRGYKFMTLDAAVDNNFNEKIRRHYGERIQTTTDNDPNVHPSEWGLQEYFKIAL